MGRELAIEIAKVVCSIYSSDRGFLEQCHATYRQFLSQKMPDFYVDVYIDPTLNSQAPRPISITSDEGIYLVNSYNFNAEVNLKARFALVRVTRGWESFDAFLRVLYSLILPSKQGLMLHASGAIKDGSGYVFAGLPESGKSTISRLSKSYKVISDELLVLRRANNHCRMFDTPFWNFGPMHGRSTNNAKVKGIFLLEKDAKTYSKYLQPLKAAVRILPHIFYEPERLDLNRETLEACGSIIDVTPCYELHFLPDKEDIWRCLDEVA